MNTSVLDTLNENQKEAAATIDSHVRIIAGAGSGKTRVLMARIVYLVKECGVFPNRILAITFTNKATNEMKDRLKAQLGDLANTVRVSTIHSLCVRILREDADAIGYPKSFTILDSDDQKQILRPLYKKYAIDVKSISYVHTLSSISNYKTGHIDPEQAIQMAMSDHQRQVAVLYKEYQSRLKEMKAMDFDDLLLEAHRLLKSSESVRMKWQRRLDYIHVDEFQDVDPIQYEIICMLVGKDSYLCVVGDPDQTIYTWRGASVDIILRFDKDFYPCKTVILNQNYRSTQPILNASNALIKYNQDRIDKDLFTQMEGNQKILLHECKEENEEPLFVAREIARKHRENIEYKDMAILYRSNYSSRSFERVLRQVGIPYIIYGGIRFYERQEIKDALCYLRLLTNKDEKDPEQFSLDLAVLRIINQPRRGIGAKTMESLQEEATHRHINLYEALKDPQTISAATARKCKKFVELIEEIRSHREDYSLEDYLDYVLETVGYYKMLEEENEEERKENLKELKADIAQSLQEDPSMTLESYLQEVSLFTDKSQEEKQNSVSLMTVHAAKGLEFEVVYLVNFNDGVFPSSRALDEGGRKSLEEERRLCYVAMTRAKRDLTITWNNGYSYMLETYKTPSRFLMEIPEKYTEDPTKPKKQEIKKTAVSTHSFTPKPSGKKGKIRKGDLVNHTVYGQGIVLKLENSIATIAFSHGVGVKKLNALHPSLKKMG